MSKPKYRKGDIVEIRALDAAHNTISCVLRGRIWSFLTRIKPSGYEYLVRVEGQKGEKWNLTLSEDLLSLAGRDCPVCGREMKYQEERNNFYCKGCGIWIGMEQWRVWCQ